jgi:hypothetical protein
MSFGVRLVTSNKYTADDLLATITFVFIFGSVWVAKCLANLLVSANPPSKYQNSMKELDKLVSTRIYCKS